MSNHSNGRNESLCPHRLPCLSVALLAALHLTLVAPLAHAEDPSPYSTRAVYVHVDSPEPVDLQRATGDRHVPFEPVCTSPCDTLVPVDGDYRIASDSVRPSRSFTLFSGAQREDMRVKPASTNGFTAGIALMSTGGLSIVIGGMWLLSLSFAAGPTPQDDGGRPIALGLVVGGLVAIAGGIVFTVLNAKTKVSSTVTTPPPSVKPREREPNPERTVLLPTRGDTAMEKALPTPASVPILALQF